MARRTRDGARCVVRMSGAKGYEWEVGCDTCTSEATHFHKAIGAISVNTRGVGNRLWIIAMVGAYLHIDQHDRMDELTELAEAQRRPA